MPIQTAYFREHELIYNNHSGIITIDAVLSVYEKLKQSAASDGLSFRYAINDLRSVAAFEINDARYKEFAAVAADDAKSDAFDWHVAFVATSPTQQHMALQYVAACKQYGSTHLEAFHTMEDAFCWLNIENPTLEEQLDQQMPPKTAHSTGLEISA